MSARECRIGVDTAIAIVDLLDAVGAAPEQGYFRCVECGEPVRPHRSPGRHFEHVERNPDCPLSG